MRDEKKIEILILDDEPIVCKRLKPALEKQGYAVETFYSSRDAARRIHEKTFDIVVTDLKMDGMNGMQFLSEVKRVSQATQVIIITGYGSMETAKESFKLGVFDFLTKPFKLGEIQEIIKKAEKKLREVDEDPANTGY